ncbi:MAG: TMEM165/GDT1 family protein [Candidatus Bathyarchaeia archaeon]
MFEFAALAASFGIIAVAELGDKTQVAAVTLASRYRPLPVFAGCLLGVGLANGAGVAVGSLLDALLPLFWIRVSSGVAFVLLGVYGLVSKGEGQVRLKRQGSALFASASLIALMEFGDKTQLAAIFLTAQYDAPVEVFLGAMLAFSLLMGLGVAVGATLTRLVPQRYIKAASSLLFIAFGISSLVLIIAGAP